MKSNVRTITICATAVLLLSGLGLLIIPSFAEGAYTGTVTINSDGTVSPSDAPIDRQGKVYKLTDDIDGMLVVLRSNIEVNGMGYTITGDLSDYGIYLDNVNGVTVKNFYVYYAYMGIRLDTSCGCTIKDNTVANSRNMGIGLWYYSNDNTVKDNYLTGNNAGVGVIYYSTENIVKDNMVVSNGYGLDTFRSDYNMFKDNTVTSHSRWGIGFRFSANNVARNNYVDTTGGSGITIYYGTGGHTVQDNSIMNCGWAGVELYYEGDIMVKDNEIYDTYIGVGSWFTWDISIISNYITGSIVPGVYIDTATTNLVHGNEIVDNGFGVYFWNSDEYLDMDNTITCNIIQDNDYGFYTDDVTVGPWIAYDCGGNTIHHNYIIDNDVQVYEGYDNFWDNGKGEGNYWSDYEGEDTDHDGVGDTDLPHNGVDYYPLMY
ncbi:MAG: nitrous oxide reductase family maturation protein NosD [Thermoplasmatota archaeon]